MKLARPVLIIALALAVPSAAAAKLHLVRHLGQGVPRFVPRNVDVDSHGRVVVSSALTDKAVFFSAKGKVVAKPSIKVGEYAGLGFASDGRVAIAPQAGDPIPAFSATGKHIGDYLPPPGTRGGLRVVDVAFDSAGNLYGTNVGSDQGPIIGVWAPDFSFARGLPVPNQTSIANGIEPGPNGLLYYDTMASDGETVLIMRLKPDGTYLSPIRLNSTLSLTITGWDVDRKGELFLLTAGLVPGDPASIWEVSPSGSSTRRLLKHPVVQHKTPPRQGSGLSAIAVDSSGRHVYLSDIDHHRVDEYKK